ncbi:MAG: radical SAM protein [Deltaproteobacteria bacterium]|nr:radical SAM protein [Deltaproteobacteria bacterium]
MRCDQPCQHCGSRSGKARSNELTTEELFEVGRGLARLGAREITLIGGEAYLREDCEQLIRFLADLGMRVTMQTGGRAFTPELARRFRDAGLDGVGVSLDGPARAHDRLRGNLGSHQQALRALDTAREAGFAIGANTQINKLNCEHLPETAKLLRERGVETWQVQLTGPMGRAADHPEWIIDPWQIVPIIDTLAAIQLDAAREYDGVGRPFNVFANNNIGYFGPHEQVIRSRPFGRENHWRGCQAGVFALGIESDGTVKACPTLPTAPYQGGNVRTLTIEQLWERSEALAFARERTADELWGFCKTCYYADTCRAGCSWTAHTTLGRRGNMPFCYHRVTQLRKKGLRERLVKVEEAPRLPFDFGRFEIVEEPWPAP